MSTDPELDRFNFLFVNFVFFVADNFKDFFIFGSGLSGLGIVNLIIQRRCKLETQLSCR